MHIFFTCLLLCFYFTYVQLLRGCFDLPNNATSGFYTIEYIVDDGVKINATNYCMMEFGGGWTLIARSHPDVNFPSSKFGWKSHSADLTCEGIAW